MGRGYKEIAFLYINILFLNTEIVELISNIKAQNTRNIMEEINKRYLSLVSKKNSSKKSSIVNFNKHMLLK